MATATIFEKLFALLTSLITLLGSFSFNTNFERADDEIKFTINANTVISEELPNVVNNVNIWSIEGNPFVDAKVNEENNNKRGSAIEITTSDSQVKSFVIPTDEEVMIARDAYTISEQLKTR